MDAVELSTGSGRCWPSGHVIQIDKSIMVKAVQPSFLSELSSGIETSSIIVNLKYMIFSYCQVITFFVGNPTCPVCCLPNAILPMFVIILCWLIKCLFFNILENYVLVISTSCVLWQKFKPDWETMALVENQQHKSSKMWSVFMDCQSGHHSHASLIKSLTKIYNNVSYEV